MTSVAIEAIAERYQKRLTVSTLAAVLGTSPSHLAHLFTREVGLPVHQFLLRVRLRAAAYSRLTTSSKLDAVAQECGFSDGPHFLRTAHRLGERSTVPGGDPPKQWKRRPDRRGRDR
jgi:AraC-like DNA-binding protein